MVRWICNIEGKWIKVIFNGALGIDKYNNQYMFKDYNTIYEGCWDDFECAFQVENEYTPHMERGA